MERNSFVFYLSFYEALEHLQGESYIRVMKAVMRYAFFGEEPTGIESVELVVCEPKLGYAGRLDRVAVINGHRFILDIKTGEKQPWHRLQLGAYFIAYKKAEKIASVHILKTGKYKFYEYDAVDAVTEWMEILELIKKARVPARR